MLRYARADACTSLGLGSNSESAGLCYIYQIQNLRHGDELAALCSDDSVRAFRPASLAYAPSWVLPTNHEGVTQLRTQQWDNQALILTAGREGVVKAWDLRTSQGQKQHARPVLLLQQGELLVRSTQVTPDREQLRWSSYREGGCYTCLGIELELARRGHGHRIRS